jgi:hypothetical protein
MAVHREMHAHSIYDEESGVQRLPLPEMQPLPRASGFAEG